MSGLPVQRQPPEISELVAALRPIVQAGLPVSPRLTDIRLLGLRGVVARAVDPEDRLNRVKALDTLLKKALQSYPDDTLGPAAAALFGLAPGTRGRNLTDRRGVAAGLAGYEADHFRKRVERRIVEQVAWLLHQDAQNYIPRERETPGFGTAPPLEASGDTPVITAGDLVTREANEHQEAVSRLWAHVYQLRANILRVERLKTWPEDDSEPEASQRVLNVAIERRDTDVRNVRILAERYIDKYGETITHGEDEFRARALLRLAGWNVSP